MSTPPVVRTTRTGRRVVPTAAAMAAAADKAALEKEKEKDKSEKQGESSKSSTPATGEKEKAGSPTRVSARAAAAASASKGKGEEPAKSTPSTPTSGRKSAPVEKEKEEEKKDTPRRGTRSAVRASSGSNEESSEPVKKAKVEEQPETSAVATSGSTTNTASATTVIEGEGGECTVDEEELSSMETQQIFEAVEKMNAEAAAAQAQAQTQVSTANGQPQVITATVIDEHQQRSAIDSILGENATIVGTVVQNADGVLEVKEYIPEVAVEVNPPWNEQGCIICNADISLDSPAVEPPKSDRLKEFFLEFFSVGDQISLEDENAYPFCGKCSEELENLLSVSQTVETMHKQFNKVRDSMARKSIKTFLSRTKPTCLEEDAKAENFGFLDEDQKRSYKDQMFHLWKSRYELVQPGPKTPIMIRSMDSRGRVTVVRLNSSGQAVPDRFGGRSGSTPLGGMGRLLTNGEDEDGGGGGSGVGGPLALYHCKDCSKSFSAKSMLAYHERVHTGELPYECDQCGKAFSVPHYLVQHVKTHHSGEKPYKCEICGKGFAQRGGLVTHNLVHTGAKPYSCQVCGKSFRQKYHLTQHNLIHSGAKPFGCELCGKAFNVKMNLREHMRRHTGDRPYKCPYCTTVGFFRKKMLKEHITKAHPQRPMPEELMGPEPSTSYSVGDSGTRDDDLEEDMDENEEEEIVPEPEDQTEEVETST